MLGASAEKHTAVMGHDHISRIKMHMAEGSFGDRNRCQQPGCNEVIDGRVVFCRTHELSCYPLGQTSQLVFPGAGICKKENCSEQARENSIYCKLHSGVSKGCMVRGCTRGAHGGTPLCIGHGGGKRCVIPQCTNAACGQGRSDRCVRHGGGKRCKFEGCAKGAQGNTDYCIRHGGGRRCKFEGCTKSAQGRTDFCIKHGGGSRCKFQGCGTSAKWGTDFCSVHRKSLKGGDDAIPEALPAPSEKRRRAKKPKKAAKPSETSQENVTTAAIAGNSTQHQAPAQHMGVLLIATPVTNRDILTKGVTVTGQTAIAPPQIVAPLSIKTPTPSGSVTTAAEREEGASRETLGL